MKRYVIFAGDRSFAAGGALDFVQDFSLEEMRAMVKWMEAKEWK